MSEVIMRAKGSTGELELLRDRVRIKRRGAVASLLHGFKGDKDILLEEISSVEFKRPGLVYEGYLQLVFIGSQDSKGGVYQAVGDANTVMFKRRQEPAFLAMKEAIEERIEELRRPAPAGGSLDDLEKLAELRDRGIVTEEEFEAKKRQLLGI